MDACRHPRLIPTRCYATSFAPLPLFAKGEGTLFLEEANVGWSKRHSSLPLSLRNVQPAPTKQRPPGTDSRFLYSENASNANYFVILCTNNSLLTTWSILTNKTLMLAAINNNIFHIK